MIYLFRALTAIALVYNASVIFRVVDDWTGLWLGIASVILLPASVLVMPILMFFIPSQQAGPFALWPAMILIFALYKIAEKKGEFLLIKP